MKMNPVFVAIVFSLIGLSTAICTENEFRQWTDPSGRSFNGYFVSSNFESVEVNKDGKIYNVSLTKLSNLDQEYVYAKLGFQKGINEHVLGGAFSGKIDYLWKLDHDQLVIRVLSSSIRLKWLNQTGFDLCNLGSVIGGETFNIKLDALSHEDQSYLLGELGYQRDTIGNLSGGGAFAGKVDYLWKIEKNQLRIRVLSWDIRFKSYDQKGRELQCVYFMVGCIEDRKYWDTGMTSEKQKIEKHISSGSIFNVSDLSFDIQLDDEFEVDSMFLVAAYETNIGRAGYNYDFSETYLTSSEKVRWPKKD